MLYCASFDCGAPGDHRVRGPCSCSTADNPSIPTCPPTEDTIDDGASATGSHGIRAPPGSRGTAPIALVSNASPEVVRRGLLEGTGEHDSGVADQDVRVAEGSVSELPPPGASHLGWSRRGARTWAAAPILSATAVAEVVADVPDHHAGTSGRQAGGAVASPMPRPAAG